MHYLDKKQRIATGLGAVFAPANVQTVDFTRPEPVTPEIDTGCAHMSKTTQLESDGALLVSRETVARRLEISIEGVKRLEKAGKLRRVIVGLRAVRYPAADLLRLVGGVAQ